MLVVSLLGRNWFNTALRVPLWLGRVADDAPAP